MMNLYGPHVHIPGSGLDLLERWKPKAALAMDVDSNYIREARVRSPNTTLVVRVYEHGDNFLEWSPVDWVSRLLARFPNERPDFFMTINEPFGHDSQELFERFDIWESEVIQLLQAQGTDGLACNFGTGNFTAGADRVRIPDVFPRICAVANAMGPHDYSWPDLQAGWSWYAGRWFQWYEDIKQATGKKMKFLLGECGLTQAIIAGRPDHGWQSGGPEGVTAESYLATLRWYLEQVVNWDAGRGIVLGLCLFNWYDQFHASFEHVNRPEVVDAIIAMDMPVPEPPEPPEEDPMKVKIVDMEYNEQTEEWAKAKYSVDWERAVVAEGEPVWRLVELWEKTGDTSVITQTLDVEGNPKPNVISAFRWKTAEQSDIAGPNDWWSNYVYGSTNDNGEVGPSMGTGAYRGEGEPCVDDGPHQVWVHDDNIKSDLLKCICMLAGTFHDHLDCKFRLMTSGTEPSEPLPTNGALLEAVLHLDTNVAAILAHLLKTPPEPPVGQPFDGEYFNNIELNGSPAMTRKDAEINFEWGSGSPDPRINPDYFSVRWTGVRTFAGPTTFHVRADDGVRLYIDNQLVIDQWHDQGPTSYKVRLPLTAGERAIQLDYYERGGGSTIKFWWEAV